MWLKQLERGGELDFLLIKDPTTIAWALDGKMWLQKSNMYMFLFVDKPPFETFLAHVLA
jgi:hypothetical protein